MYVKKKILFMLFIVIPLCVMGNERKKQRVNEKRWQLTHVIRLCENVEDGEMLCMYPKELLSESPSDLQEELITIKAQMHDSAKRLDFEKAIFLRKKWYTLKRQLKNVLKNELENKEEESADNWLPEPGLACRIGEIIYIISVHQGAKHKKKLCVRQISGSWPPIRLKSCGHHDSCRCMPEEVSCNPRYEQKKVEQVDGNLIIGEDGDGQKVKIFLSGLSKKERLIQSKITHGYKKGDRVSVLCNTGEIFLLANTAKNLKKPIIVDKR